VSENLKYLNEEFQEIKIKRRASITEDPPIFENNKYDKTDKARPAKKKGKHRQSTMKAAASSDWVEKRSRAREDARRKLEKQQQKESDGINWYLKRRNERSI
jgi:hypothetical protein